MFEGKSNGRQSRVGDNAKEAQAFCQRAFTCKLANRDPSSLAALSNITFFFFFELGLLCLILSSTLPYCYTIELDATFYFVSFQPCSSVSD